MPRIPIGAQELDGAYESHDGEMRGCLDRGTGKLIAWMDDGADMAPEFAEALEEDEGGHRDLPVPSLSSDEGDRIMEDFAASVENERVREALFDALDRRPFASFKDELARYGTPRDRWFEHHAARVRPEAVDWLESEGFERVDPQRDA